MKQESLKKIIVLALSSVMLFSSASFAAETEAPGTVNLDGPEKHLTIYTVRSEDLPSYQALDYCLEKYQAEVNNNLTWDHIYIADRPTYLQKIKTLIAAGDCPDIFDEDPDPYTTQLYKEGILKDLTEWSEENDVGSYFYDGPFNWCKFSNGTVMGLPSQNTIEMFWYNKEMWDAAGATPPEYLEDLPAELQKLQDAGYTPMSISGAESWTMLRVLEWVTVRLGDNQYLLDCARGIQKYSDPIGLQAAQFLYELGNYFHPNFGSADLAEAEELFTTGQTATYYIGSWEMSAMLDENLSEDMQGKIDYFTLPAMRDGVTSPRRINVAGGTPMCFSADKWDDVTSDVMLYYCQHMGEYQSQYEFTPAIGYDAPVGGTEHSQYLIDKIADDMGNTEGVIRLYDLEFDPTTNTNNGQNAVALALHEIEPEEFCKLVDESVAENAAEWFDDVAEDLLLGNND